MTESARADSRPRPDGDIRSHRASSPEAPPQPRGSTPIPSPTPAARRHGIIIHMG
ncbi:hypothetical protein [Microbacterium sp. MYb62]|uniref:hypothetical protein n=1 Tax=Microbacterium sp. MYb62 TaxID=1848690 RepID=UPI0015E46748|nr:hypothetical protein [Microbacterium sp. MYb62]